MANFILVQLSFELLRGLFELHLRGGFPSLIASFSLPLACGSPIPFTRANAQCVFHGLHIAL